MLRALGVLLALASAIAAFAQGDPQAGPTRPEVVRDAGHCPHDEVPEQVNAALLEWLSSLPDA